MNIIRLSDKGECEPESGPLHQVEAKGFHTKEWLSTKQALQGYPYAAMHERIVSPRILKATPDGSMLLDIGAGARPRKFASGALGGKDVRVLAFDYAEPETDAERCDWVQTDLRRLPFSCWGHKSLLEGLRSFLRFPGMQDADAPAVEALRTEVNSLILLLEGRPIGSCVFSHILRYLPEEVRKRLLGLACQSVMPGGSIHYVERPKAMRHFFPGNQQDYGTTDVEFHAVMTHAGLEHVSDIFSVPRVSKAMLQKMRIDRLNAAQMEIRVMAWVRSGAARSIDFPPEADDGFSAVTDAGAADQDLMLGGVRHITYRNSVVAGV